MSAVAPSPQLRLGYCAAEIEHLAKRGWRLLPCAVRGKKPLLKGWPTNASSDPATIRDWASRFPNCNWGVATGIKSGVFVLDVDGEAGRVSLAALERQHAALPLTLTSITGRDGGGEHKWFNYPTSLCIRSSTGTVGAKLDVQSDGKQVLVPPSTHPSGRIYQWANPSEPIADAPSWLLNLLTSKPAGQNDAPSLRMGIFVEGQRNDALFRYGCAMRRRGASQEQIERSLFRKNDDECNPPLSVEEVRGIAASAARFPVGGPDPLQTAWEIVWNEAHRRGYERFVALARQLQRARPGLPIALPLVRIGFLMECDWTQVRRWRNYAVRDGWLRLKENYIRHKWAAQYSFHEISISTVPLKRKSPKIPDDPLVKTNTGIVGHQIGPSVPPIPFILDDFSCNNLMCWV